MKYFIFFLLAGFGMPSTLFSQDDIYSKSYIEEIIQKVNSYQLANPWKETDDNWIRGTWYTGVMAVYHATGNEKYLQQCDACFWDVYGALYDREEGLFFRDIRFIPGYSGEVGERFFRPDSVPYELARRSYVYQQTKSGKKVIWSRGNGWAFAGLARVLMYLPSDRANYERYKLVFLKMAGELKNRQQPDGFWYPNLADPEDYGTPESSGTAFFTFGLTRGINNGILPRDEYLPVVKNAWAALVSVLSDEGKVQWGQLVGASPYKILQDDSHEYVTGMFLLAASEMYKLNP